MDATAEPKCTAESCACGDYRPLDDGETECHCGCPWCDNAVTDMAGLHRFADFCGDLAAKLRAQESAEPEPFDMMKALKAKLGQDWIDRACDGGPTR